MTVSNVNLNLLQSIAAAAAFYYSEALLLRFQLLILTVLGAIGTLAFCVVEWGVSRAYRMGYQSIWPQVRAFCWWLRGDECFTFSSVCWPFLHPPIFKMMWSCACRMLIDVIKATTPIFLKIHIPVVNYKKGPPPSHSPAEKPPLENICRSENYYKTSNHHNKSKSNSMNLCPVPRLNSWPLEPTLPSVCFSN